MLECRLETAAFLGQHVYHNRLIATLGEFQGADQLIQIVTVHWPEVTESELLEQHRRAVAAPAVGVEFPA